MIACLTQNRVNSNDVVAMVTTVKLMLQGEQINTIDSLTMPRTITSSNNENTN